MSAERGKYSNLWDSLHHKFDTGACLTDHFLDPYKSAFADTKLPAIDLACGNGCNSKRLIELGFHVLACDYSAEAVRQLKRNVPGADVLCFDMTKQFPLDGQSTVLVVCDMGLHFFSENDTFFILSEIKRILTPGGKVILRVNAMEDLDRTQIVSNLEHHYYHMLEGIDMRYFDECDIHHFFSDWDIRSVSREQMRRYADPREVWSLLLAKKNDGLEVVS